MRGDDFLDKMELVDPAFVEAADEKANHKNRGWVKWGAMAACFCLVALGAFFIWNSNDAHQSKPNLEQISIPELIVSGMGFESYMYYDASELDNNNPWTENMGIDTLPVYLNKAYDSSGAGLPKGLNEDEMLSMLDSAASALGVEIISTEAVTNEGNEGESVPSEIHAATDNGTIYVQADGGIVYFLPNDGISLPDNYSFTYTNTTDREADETIAYLSDVYSKFLNMETPVSVSWGDYNIYGEYHRRYTVYDSCGNDVEDILNYNFHSASFSPNDNGNLFDIRINNGLSVAEKIGDYPIVSAREAEQRLIAGNYQTSVPYTMPGKESIAKVELVYRTGRLEKMLIPYYRFYVLLPNMETDLSHRDNELQTYGAYYVPAIADEYIANMPVYDGHFN